MFFDNCSVFHHEHSRISSHDGLERDWVYLAEDLLCRLHIQSGFFRKGVDVIFAGAGEEIAFLAAQGTVGIETQQLVGLFAVGLLEVGHGHNRYRLFGL